jgi:hypothetical protein
VGLSLVALTALVAPQVEALHGLRILSFGPEAGRTGNALTPAGALLWSCGSILALTALVGPRPAPRGPHGLRGATTLDPRCLAALLSIVALAAVLRFHDLGGLPREMTSDHAEKLLNVLDILQGERPVFLPQNGGREPLQFYWTALLVALGMPLSFWTLKVGMAVVSVATVPVMFLLGRRVGGAPLGLGAAAAIALMPWHLQITRASLRSPLSTLFSALALLWILRAVQTGRRTDWICVGGVIGLGLYGYTGFRPMLVLAPLLVALRIAMGRARPSSPRAGDLVAAVLGLVLVAVPLARYAVDQPGAFFHRTLTRAGSAERPLPPDPLARLASNAVNTAAMFNLTWDRTWLQSPPGRPALETIGGALFLLGLVGAGRRARRGSWEHAAGLVTIPIMLLASAFALAFPIEVPHLARAAGALPAVALVIAIALCGLYDRWQEGGRRWVGATAVALLLALMAAGAVHRLFTEYREAYDRRSLPVTAGAAVVRSFLQSGGRLEQVYLVGWPHGWDYRALALELGAPGWRNVLWGVGPDLSDAVREATTHAGDPAAKLYLVGGPRAPAAVAFLRAVYPEATVASHLEARPERRFWSVRVAQRRAPAE